MLIDNLKSLILSKIDLPKINKIKNINFPNLGILNTYQTKISIEISLDELKEIISNPENSYIEENFNKLKDLINGKYSEDRDVSSLNEISCLFCISEKFYFDVSYIKQCIDNEYAIILDIYEYDEIRKYSDSEFSFTGEVFRKIILPKIKECEIVKSIENINFENSSDIITSFEDIYYNSNLKLDDLEKPIQVLCTNISYSSYSNQILSPNTFYWDYDSKSFKFGDIDFDKFKELSDEISKEGIVNPILLNFDNGYLYPLNINDSIILFITKLFRLKTIPVILYSSPDINTKDVFMEKYKLSEEGLTKSCFMYLQDDIKPYILFNNKIENEKYIEKYENAFFLDENFKEHTEETYTIDEETLNSIEKDLMKKFGEE